MLSRLTSSKHHHHHHHHDDLTDSTHHLRDTDSHHSDMSTSDSFGRRVHNEFEEQAIRCFRYFIVSLIVAVTVCAVVFSRKYLKDQQDTNMETEVSSNLV